MSKIKIINIEQISSTKIKVFYDQNVKTDAQYYNVNNYILLPTTSISSIETSPASLSTYSIINFSVPLVNSSIYKVTVVYDSIKNILGESFEIDYNSYSFITQSTSPYITNIVALNESQIQITYDRNITDTALNVNNYNIYSDLTGHSIALKNITRSSATVVVLNVNTIESYMTDNFDHVCSIKNITDYAGNIVDSSITYTFLGICTTLTRLTNLIFDTSFIPNKITLTFDNQLDPLSIENFLAFKVFSATGYPPYISSTSIVNDCKTVVLEISETTGSQTYTVQTTNYLSDKFGNNINPSYNSLTFTGSGHRPTLKYLNYVSDSVLEIYFDEDIRDNQYSRDVLNYAFDNGLTVSKVLGVKESTITLLVNNFVKGIKYTLTITNPGFVDNAGNQLNFPATTFIEVPVDELYLDKGIKLYEFLTAGLRDLDKDSLALKRYVDIFQNEFDKHLERIRKVESLTLLSKVDDEYLKYFLLKYGWYGHEDILENFNDNKLRYILKISPALWKRRGASGSYVEVLNTMLNINSYEKDFFEFRSILDISTYLTHQNNSTDFVLIDYSDMYNVFLNIVDPENSINRTLVEKIVNLWRSTSESVTLVYYKLYELFDYNFVSTKYKIMQDDTTHVTNTSYIVENGYLKFSQAAKFETIYSSSNLSKQWTKKFSIYANFTPKTFTGIAGDYFYFVVKHNDGLNNHYLIRIAADNKLRITRTSDSLSVVVDLSTFDLVIQNNKTYGLKLEFEEFSTTDYIKVFIEGILVYNASHAQVTTTGNIGAGKSAKECWISELKIYAIDSSNTKRLE